MRDAQPVFTKHPSAPHRLRAPVFGCIAPPGYGVLALEKGQREHLARIGKAPEPLDRNEHLDPVQKRPQLGGDIEIGGFLSLVWLDLEDDRDHTSPPCGAEASFRKVRSSRSRNRSRMANS